ncbi:MAG: DUF2330 domain-containing protein [Polyangiaceae bacterium]|nr:DUF2330 domain-containing protein [Polyangiaceae bacterium]
MTSHRMALSISSDQTVLWDQIRYSGAPSEFAWVLPIKSGARIEIASDAFFDVLDAATNPIVFPPEVTCGGSAETTTSSCSVGAGAGMGCGGDDAGGGGGDDFELGPTDGVTIVSHGSAGPYETVVLSSEDPAALTQWLDEHDYTIPEEIEPVIEQYVEEGFDFVALRLAPGAGIQQMRPVRVVMQGAVPVLPLRMVAAGSGARTAITLFVIGEGRYTPANFVEGEVDPFVLKYDFATGLSNYVQLRDAAFERNAQQTWLVPYSMPGTLLGSLGSPNGLPLMYRTTASGQSGYPRMSDAIVQQAYINGETTETSCAEQLAALEHDRRRVVDPCFTGTCRGIDHTTEIDRRELACDAPIGSDVELDDLAVALTGQHPADVWLTRLDANLGRSAFGRDLELVAAPELGMISPYVTPNVAENAPCASAVVVHTSSKTPRDAARLGVVLVLSLVVSAATARRLAKMARFGKKAGVAA